MLVQARTRSRTHFTHSGSIRRTIPIIQRPPTSMMASRRSIPFSYPRMSSSLPAQTYDSSYPRVRPLHPYLIERVTLAAMGTSTAETQIHIIHYYLFHQQLQTKPPRIILAQPRGQCHNPLIPPQSFLPTKNPPRRNPTNPPPMKHLTPSSRTHYVPPPATSAAAALSSSQRFPLTFEKNNNNNT